MQRKTYPALSYWEKEVWFEGLDVIIIGGGIVGLNAAWQLKQLQKDLKVLVIERGVLPSGASTRNAGFACFGSLTELLSDQTQMGETAMFDLVAQRYEGLIRMREKLGDKYIGYQQWGGYELFRSSEESLFANCKEAVPYFNQRLQAITGLENTYKDTSSAIYDLGFKGVNGLIWNQAEGQIHTGRMMHRLEMLVRSHGINIINGLTVSGIEDHQDGVLLQTEQGWELSSKSLIVATNGFARQLLPQEAIQPARNQVLITEPISGLSLKGCFHYDQGYYYFRNINGRILLGGGRNLAFEQENTSEFGLNPTISKRLLDLLHNLILPGRHPKVEQWWSGIMGVGDKKKPIIRKVSPNVTIAIRLGGMGVAIGSWVGEKTARKCLAASD